MDNFDDKDKVFPEEYAHLEEILNQALNRINSIDEQLKGNPNDKGPTPKLNFPGFPGQGPKISGGNSGSSSDNRYNPKKLEEEKDRIIDDTLIQINEGLKDADPEVAKEAKGKSLNKLDPNKFSDLSKDELKKASSQERTINESQKLADTFIKRRQEEKNKDTDKAKNPEPPEDPDKGPNGSGKSKATADKGKSEAYQNFSSNAESISKDSRMSKEASMDKGNKPVSMSSKFSQSLDYTKAKDNKATPDRLAEKSPSKGNEKFKSNGESISKDSRKKEEPGKGTEKPMSMSSKFSQSLGYSKMKEGDKTVPDKSPSQKDKIKDNSNSISKDSRNDKQPESGSTKPMSMSGKFSQSLGYSKSKGAGSSPEKSSGSSPSKSTPSPSSPGKGKD